MNTVHCRNIEWRSTPRNYFLQNADDYLHVLENGVKYVLEESKVNKMMY